MLKNTTTQNQSFYTLPSSPFDKNKVFAWPETFDDTLDLLETIYHYENKDQLFSHIEFPSKILNKIKSWSFSEICCSLYYCHFEKIFQQRQRRGDPAIDAQVWITASTFILNP